MRDEIIKMARASGMEQEGDNFFSLRNREEIDVHIIDLERFFHMAQAAEREACAKVCEQDKNRADDWIPDSRPGGYFAAVIRARGAPQNS